MFKTHFYESLPENTHTHTHFWGFVSTLYSAQTGFIDISDTGRRSLREHKTVFKRVFSVRHVRVRIRRGILYSSENRLFGAVLGENRKCQIKWERRLSFKGVRAEKIGGWEGGKGRYLPRTILRR